jgi:hypothetical protein
VNLDKVVPDTSLSIKQGALAPHGPQKSNWIFKQLELIAQRFEFSLSDSFEKIPKAAKEMIFYGGNEKFDVESKTLGITRNYKIEFEARKILSFVSEAERLITIEDAAELRPTQPNTVTLMADREARERSADQLLTATLRMRPDRIVLGEVRGKEAMTFLEAINTGHGGSLTTLHAETPQLAIQRFAIAALKTDVPMTYQDMIHYITRSIDVIIQAGRHEGARGITEFYLPSVETEKTETADV